MKKLVIIILVCTLLIAAGCSKKPIIFNFPDFPPYSWVDANGQAKGIYIDIINEVVHDRMGIPVVYRANIHGM